MERRRCRSTPPRRHPPVARPAATGPDIYDELAKLNPPRKQYGRYYATRQAAEDMRNPPQGMHAFLRAYFYMKSADWKQNKPFRLKDRSATELAKLPPYYMMDLNKTMPQTVAEHMPSAAEIAATKWLTDDELSVYSTEYSRTGFQGGLQVYRGSGERSNESQLFAGRTIDQPSMFISGKSDWGVFQGPGALERMQTTVCTQHDGHTSARRRRTLGGSGTARAGEQADSRISPAPRAAREVSVTC